MGTIDSCSSTDIVKLFPRGTIGFSSNVIVSHGNATEYKSDFFPEGTNSILLVDLTTIASDTGS